MFIGCNKFTQFNYRNKQLATFSALEH